ncbi:unnamed protein product [Rhizopus stolonifer]
MYVKNLSKLTRKHYLSNKAAMGTFLPLWEILQQELSAFTQIHADYSKKIIEAIEQPMRQCIVSNPEFDQIQSMEESMNRISREHDDLELKIQKNKRSGSKGESKASELTKQQEKKIQEWKKDAPDYLKKYQALDEHRWTVMKSLVKEFETLQQVVSEKSIEITKTALDATESLSVENEIAHFCSILHHEPRADILPDHDSVVPETSQSESSLKQTSGKKKRFFSSLVSIRRKPKNGIPEPNRQRSFSHSGSLAEVNSIHSVQSRDISHEPSTSSPHLRKAASFSTATMEQQEPPLVVVDSEGYSIPPPDRGIAWPSEASESLVETEDMSSDAGSLFSNNTNPRIRVDIKNEVVAEEDASNAAVALTRVATLLKEKNANPTARRLRGRREVRATQLYSVMEQPIAVSPFEEEEGNNQPVDLPTINVAITETIHVMSKSGQTEKATLAGEVHVQYTGPTQSASPVCFRLQLDPAASIELTEHVCLASDNVYQLTTLASESNIVLRYQLDLVDLETLVIKPMWKCDADKTRLLVKYQKKCAEKLENIVFVTSVTGDVQQAQSIPAGELSLAHGRIKWNLGTLETPEEAVIKAQFETKEQGSPQPIAVRFDLYDQLLSSADISQGNDLNILWATIRQVKKHVKSGRFIAV